MTTEKAEPHIYCRCPSDSPFLWALHPRSYTFTPVELRARHSEAASITVAIKRSEGKDYGQIMGLSKKSATYTKPGKLMPASKET